MGFMIFGLLRGTNPVEARDVELLHERIVPFELWKEILFDHGVRRARVEQGVSPKDWTHLYVNPTQPLYPKDHPDHAVVNVVIEGQDVGLLYTNELLPVSDVAEYRLLAPPDAWKDALAKLAEHRGRPVELAVDLRKGEQEIYLLFKNPRGIWQLSNFDRRGPVGHA